MRFFPDFDREGPDGDLPRKTGLPRFWEVLSRDFGDIFRAGLLALLGGVPFLVGLAFSLTSHVLLFAPVCGFVGGAVAGPQLCGLADTILRGLRDEPGFWWHTYRRAWKRSAKDALLLFLGQLPRSVGALAILAGYLGLMTRFFTLAVTILPFTNLWIPMFPALFLIYPGIDENFRIEEQLRGK